MSPPDPSAPNQSRTEPLPHDAEPAVDASTVLVLREAPAGHDFEVFLVRRHAKSAFMANRYVYPGGKLDPGDCTERASAHVVGMSPDEARQRLDEAVDPLVAQGLFLAGVRETFEEAGLLLAHRRGESSFIDLTSEQATADRFETYRDRLIDGDLALTEVADREDLVIPLDRLGYFAHWITPYIESRRYDTRFFVALAPEHQEPLHDAVETTDGVWISPSEAIARCHAGEMLLAPPTLRTLQHLTAFDTAADALAFARGHHPPTLLPHMEMRDDQVWLFLPGDPEYPADQPGYQRYAQPAGEVTRMVMEDLGRWRVVEPD